MTDLTVSLALLGEPRNLTAEALEMSTSPVTGRALRRLRLELGARGTEQHERLLAELEAAANGNMLIAGTDDERWKVTSHSYSYRDDRITPTFEHTVDLEEDEQLALDRVEFRGLSLIPGRWSAEASLNGRVSVNLLIDMDPEKSEQFEQALESYSKDSVGSAYFPVLLSGFSDDEISMRFGRCIWQSHEDGSTRHMIVLVSEQGDSDGPNFLLGEPQTQRLKERSLTSEVGLRALIEELERSGVLSREAIRRIDEKTNKPDWAMIREFDRASSIEEFFS
jgi:mRNA-degrading endonuclease toxin of MazEF toxin-antitoxin module